MRWWPRFCNVRLCTLIALIGSCAQVITARRGAEAKHHIGAFDHLQGKFPIEFLLERAYWYQYTEYYLLPHMRHFRGIADLLDQLQDYTREPRRSCHRRTSRRFGRAAAKHTRSEKPCSSFLALKLRTFCGRPDATLVHEASPIHWPGATVVLATLHVELRCAKRGFALVVAALSVPRHGHAERKAMVALLRSALREQGSHADAATTSSLQDTAERAPVRGSKGAATMTLCQLNGGVDSLWAEPYGHNDKGLAYDYISTSDVSGEFFDAPTLLHLDGVCRSLQGLVTFEDVACRLPVEWGVHSTPSLGDAESVRITVRRGWTPEFTKEKSVLETAMAYVPSDPNNRRHIDQRHGRKLIRSRGWLDSEDFDDAGDPSHVPAREDPIDTDYGWRVFFTFKKNLSVRDAKSRAMSILTLAMMDERLEDDEEEDSPVGDVVGGPASKADIRKCIAFLFRCADRLKVQFHCSECGVDRRHTDLPSEESRDSLMLLFGAKTRIELTGRYFKQELLEPAVAMVKLLSEGPFAAAEVALRGPLARQATIPAWTRSTWICSGSYP
eukprot:s3903_g2.t2